MNPEWEPGDPLFSRFGCHAQPMIKLKHDSQVEGIFSSKAARWSPEFGWRDAIDSPINSPHHWSITTGHLTLSAMTAEEDWDE